MYLSVKVFYFF